MPAPIAASTTAIVVATSRRTAWTASSAGARSQDRVHRYAIQHHRGGLRLRGGQEHEELALMAPKPLTVGRCHLLGWSVAQLIADRLQLDATLAKLCEQHSGGAHNSPHDSPPSRAVEVGMLGFWA